MSLKSGSYSDPELACLAKVGAAMMGPPGKKEASTDMHFGVYSAFLSIGIEAGGMVYWNLLRGHPKVCVSSGWLY